LNFVVNFLFDKTHKSLIYFAYKYFANKISDSDSKMINHITKDVAISGVMQSLRRIFKAIQDYSYAVSNQFGITGPQLWVLKTISQNEILNLSELGKRMCHHPSTMTGLIDRLEKKGYVERDRGREDRRIVKLSLTPKGKELVRRAPNPIQGKMIYGLRKLRKGELHSIYRSVQKLVEVMEAQDAKATFFFDQE
jgi:DNA-binding MarR family transcriptional regulator